MKTSIFKKTAAAVAAVLMTAALAVPAFAVNTPTSGTAPAIDADEYTLTKSIQITNAGGEKVYEPNLTYSYEIKSVAPGDAAKITGKLVSDATKTGTVKVQEGPAGGALLSLTADGATPGTTVELVFGDDTAPSAPGTVSESFKIVTNSAAFETPGVYRYEIDQDVDKAAAGVSEDEDDVFGTERKIFLDVYVKANDDGISEVYGLVLFKAGEKDTAFSYDEDADETLKINALDPDKYETYNVVVKKEIAGDMADKGHEFPFKVQIDGSIAGAELTTVENDQGTTKKEGETTSDSVKVSDFAEAKDYAFCDGDYIQINGIPQIAGTVSATIKVNETNDTPDDYNLTVKKNDTVVDAYAETPVNGDSTVRSFALENESANDEILYINTLDAISPTGLFFRIAPFAFLAAAGGALFAVASRGKKREEEAETI